MDYYFTAETFANETLFGKNVCDATVKPQSSTPIINDNWFAIRFTRLKCLDRNTYSDSLPSLPPPLSCHFPLQWHQISWIRGGNNWRVKLRNVFRYRNENQETENLHPKAWNQSVYALTSDTAEGFTIRALLLGDKSCDPTGLKLTHVPAVTRPRHKKAHQPHKSE